MPRTPEQNEEIRQQRIQQILTAAMHVYLEKGVRGAEIGDIAERAGIARGLVYHYYKDKLTLFRALFEQSREDAKLFVESTLISEYPPLTRLETYVRHFMRSAMERPYYVRFYSTLQYDVPFVFGDEAATFMHQMLHDISEPLRRTMQEAMDLGLIRRADPGLAASLFWGSILGGMNVFMRDPAPDRFEERMKQVTELVFEGFVVQ